MNNIIKLPSRETIDVTTVNRKLRAGLIAPADEAVDFGTVDEHTAEPIKDMDTIIKISKFLTAHQRFRDNMLFIVGINSGLRVSDLRLLTLSHFITDDLIFKGTFSILEKKTQNTRKRKKNRCITINNAIIDSIVLYLENTPGVKLSDYMFRSNSNRNKNNIPLHRNSIDNILKGIARDLELGIRMATHSLRKTFAYHQMVMSGNDPRKLMLLQKMFGHSTSAQTLDYIGITGEEIDEAYRKLNLGSETSNYLVDSDLTEQIIQIA